MKFILASQSPRRYELLKSAGYDFEVVPAISEEKIDKNLPVEEVPKALALHKAKEVFEKTGKITLAADTIVVLDGVILGKPKDKAENEKFLRALSGRTHLVYTGYAIIGGGYYINEIEKAEVIFNALTEEVIKEYVEAGLGLDKAGGYGVQDEYGLVKKVVGSFTCVMGLPMEKINEAIEELK